MSVEMGALHEGVVGTKSSKKCDHNPSSDVFLILW